MSIKDLTAEQLEWLKENFCHTKNQELADELGTSPRSVIRMARTLGLWKTSKFVAAMQQNAADHAARANRANGGNAGAKNLLLYGKAYQFKKGERQKDKMSAEAFDAMHRRIGEQRKNIFKAESRVNLIKGNERINKSRQIKEDIRFIADRMQQNRALIKKLQDQLKNSNFRGSEMKKVITNMLKQLDEKDQQLQQLRAELEAKNIHIAELDETIEGLNTNVSNLQSENAQKAETINNQDVQLNTAWYVYGTKKELKDQRILVDGKVLQSSFNKNYFMKIDIRVPKAIKLYSKSVKLLTTHPSGSYQLVTDENKQYVLQITTPQLFWSTSKYLVVLVK